MADLEINKRGRVGGGVPSYIGKDKRIRSPRKNIANTNTNSELGALAPKAPPKLTTGHAL